MREEVENPMVKVNNPAEYDGHKKGEVTFCLYCDHPLFEDEKFLAFKGNHYCDTTCLFDYHDIVEVKGSELID
jgi:hypothetical protein